MSEKNREKLGSVKTLIDALPSVVFIVDYDYKIIEMNPMAKELFETPPETIIQKLCGDIFCCFHALISEEGCGTTPDCEHCVIRNSVYQSSVGESVKKREYALEIFNNGIRSELQLLVTTFPFIYEERNVIVLVLDDVTELTTLKKLLPICSQCKSIRDDEDSWREISSYLRSISSLEFTHSICPECMKELYPDFND